MLGLEQVAGSKGKRSRKIGTSLGEIFRKKGYIIGSGAVEGSCKSVINQRADLAGQRWHPDGALNVLRIRGMVMDGIHEEYWKRRGTIRRRKVA